MRIASRYVITIEVFQAGAWVYPFFIAPIPRRTCSTLANGCGQITALPAFETLLTLRILARRARLTSLCPVENDDITIKLPSAYGNWLNYQISSTNINTSTPRDRASLRLPGSILNDVNSPSTYWSIDVHSSPRLHTFLLLPVGYAATTHVGR